MPAAIACAAAALVAVPPGGCGISSRSHSALKRSRSSARSIDSGLVPDDRDAGVLERVGELQRRLAAERHDHAAQLPCACSVWHTLRTPSIDSGSKKSRSLVS